MVFGEALRLPGEFFVSADGDLAADPAFVVDLMQKKRQMRPVPPAWHGGEKRRNYDYVPHWRVCFDARQFGAFHFGDFHFDAILVRRVSLWRASTSARFYLARFHFGAFLFGAFPNFVSKLMHSRLFVSFMRVFSAKKC